MAARSLLVCGRAKARPYGLDYMAGDSQSRPYIQDFLRMDYCLLCPQVTTPKWHGTWWNESI